MKFTGILAQIISTPIITCESPTDLTFTTKVQGDVIVSHYMGPGCRQLKDMLRKGDYVKMNGIARDGVLVVGHITMDESAAVGRQLNTYA